MTWSSSRCRTARPAAVAEALGDDVLVVDCGADFRLSDPRPGSSSTAASTPARGRTGSPSCPAHATRCGAPGGSRSRAATRPSRRLSLVPAPGRGPRRARRRGRRSLGHVSGAGKAAKTNLLGSEVMGTVIPYGVGGGHRHTPEIEQNLGAAAGVTVTVSFTPVLVPMSRGILATCIGPARRRASPPTTSAARRTSRRTPTSRSCISCPRGSGPRPAVLGANAAHLQVAVDERAGRSSSSARSTTSSRAPPARAIQCMNIALGPRRDHGPDRDRGRAMSVTASAGLRSRRRRRRDSRPSGGRTSPSWSTRARCTPRAAVFTANRVQGQPDLWSRAGHPGRRRVGDRAQLGRRQLLHRPGRLPDHPRRRPRRVAEVAAIWRGRRHRLLDGADRPGELPRDRSSPEPTQRTTR